MFPDDQPWEVKEAIRRVVEYVIENPEAKDTLDGIERWWLRTPAPTPSRQLVERAVGALVRAGWLNTLADSRPVFQVSELGLKAGMAYLNQIQQNHD